MNEEIKKESRQSTNNKINVWKWAFIALAAIILSSLFLLFRALQPVKVGEPNQNPSVVYQDDIELSTSLNKKDTEKLLNTYLSFSLEDDFENYYVKLSENLQIEGRLKVLGSEVPFTLLFDPYVMDNGNVQLRGKGVELANFNLPVNLVMRLVGNQIDFPEFIAFDSESRMIIINLNELSKDFNFELEMNQIDLINDVIELNIRLDENTIMKQF